MSEHLIKKTRRKRQKWRVGDCFLIPLLGGEFATGQVIGKIEEAYSAICLLFNIKLKDNPLKKIEKISDKDIISIVVTTRESLDYGEWKVFFNAEPLSVENYVDIKKVEKDIVGVKIRGAGIVEDFLNAFYGLSPWDIYYEPDYFDNVLISPDKKPRKLLYKKDFEK